MKCMVVNGNKLQLLYMRARETVHAEWNICLMQQRSVSQEASNLQLFYAVLRGWAQHTHPITRLDYHAYREAGVQPCAVSRVL